MWSRQRGKTQRVNAASSPSSRHPSDAALDAALRPAARRTDHYHRGQQQHRSSDSGGGDNEAPRIVLTVQ